VLQIRGVCFSVVVYDVNLYIIIIVTQHNGMASVKKITSVLLIFTDCLEGSKK